MTRALNMRPGKRKTILLSERSLVTERPLQNGSPLPWLIEPAVDGLSLVDWADGNRDLIEQRLLNRGAVLFRNFKAGTTQEFERFMESLCGELLEYSFRSTPRTQVSGRIYTSTEYPAHQTIPPLRATQVMARIYVLFQIDLPLRTIFERATVAELALTIEESLVSELEQLPEDEATGLQ